MNLMLFCGIYAVLWPIGPIMGNLNLNLGNACFGKEWTGNPSLTNGKFYYHTIVDSE